MRKLSWKLLPLVAACLLVPCAVFAVSSTLTVQIVPASSGSGVCNNPSVPHPAQVAGFTTLAYCADFTQQATTNNVVNHTSGIMPWTTLSNWLQCAGASSPQWALLNNNGLGNNCSGISVGNDPVAGSNTLIMNVRPSDGGSYTLGIATHIQGGAELMTYAGVNNYFEIKYRIATSQMGTVPIGQLAYDWWSWYRDGCGFEVDFIETYSSGGSSGVRADAAQGITDWCNLGNHGSGGDLSLGNNWDSNYHVAGSLTTSNGSSGQIGQCAYLDGAPTPSRSSPGGPPETPRCQTSTPTQSQQYNQMSWLLLWNNAAQNSAVTNDVTNWIEWIRVWSCAGWNNGSPGSGTNNCVVSPPFTGTPP